MVSLNGVDRGLGLYIPISDHDAAQILDAGISPLEFARFVLEFLTFEECIEKFQKSRGVAAKRMELLSYTMAPGVQTANSPAASSRSKRSVYSSPTSLPLGGSETWSESSFLQFLDVIADNREFKEPLLLLASYEFLGPSPSSQELKSTCHFEEERLWQEKLRVAKTRLTVQARNMGKPPLFPRPQTTESGRLHPINPTLYLWLKNWFASRKDLKVDPSDWGDITNGV